MSRELLKQALDCNNKAISALEQYLAKLGQAELAKPEQAEKQEPVACFIYVVDSDTWVQDYSNMIGQPFYTYPPRKEWVGLTEFEVSHYNNRLSGSGVAEEIQAKLKERNT